MVEGESACGFINLIRFIKDTINYSTYHKGNGAGSGKIDAFRLETLVNLDCVTAHAHASKHEKGYNFFHFIVEKCEQERSENPHVLNFVEDFLTFDKAAGITKLGLKVDIKAIKTSVEVVRDEIK